MYNNINLKPIVDGMCKHCVPAPLRDDSAYIIVNTLNMEKVKPLFTEICSDTKKIINIESATANRLLDGRFFGTFSDDALQEHGFVIYKLREVINNLYAVNTQLEVEVPRHWWDLEKKHNLKKIIDFYRFSKDAENKIRGMYKKRLENLEFVGEHNTVLNNSNFTNEAALDYSHIMWNMESYHLKFSTEISSLKWELVNIEFLCSLLGG